MKTIASSLFHRVLSPNTSGGRTHPTVLLLHGRGADEEDLLGLAPSLDTRFLIISARAPYPFPQSGGFTWYNLQEDGAPEPSMFSAAYEMLTTFVDDIHRGYPVDPTRLFLFGFSMGTVMSYAVALTHPERIRGVVAHSGYIPEEASLAFRWTDLSRTAFMVAHGTQDHVLPIELARRARQLLTQTKARVHYCEYPIAHSISEESLSECSAWLSRMAGWEREGEG